MVHPQVDFILNVIVVGLDTLMNPKVENFTIKKKTNSDKTTKIYFLTDTKKNFKRLRCTHETATKGVIL